MKDQKDKQFRFICTASVIIFTRSAIILSTAVHCCNRNYSTPIANQVYWQILQTFSCLQWTNQTKVMEIAQHNKRFKWFSQIQLKIQLLMTSAVSKLFNPFMASIFTLRRKGSI